MRLGIGIDTGGTYTDAVIYDFENKKVLSSSKSLTTKKELSIGIGQALDGLDKKLLMQAKSVSLSTTLATNACVEKKGGRGKLLFIGVDEEVVNKVGDGYGLQNGNEIYYCDNNASFDGKQVTIPNWENLLRDTNDWMADADGLAIVEIFPMNNGAVCEKEAKEKYGEKYNIPIICGHELYSDLNSIQRGATTLLNVKLIPIIREFIASMKIALNSRDINVPMIIVRSDGSLMSEKFSLSRPVETILCGPAASVLGGVALTNESDSMIVDIGGTTTDISLIKSGVPKKVGKGINIGEWRTFVKGVFVDTFALGGDSAIRIGKDGIHVDSRRVMPVSLAAQKWPSVIRDLSKLLKSNTTHQYPIHEFFYLVKDIDDVSKYSDRENKLCEVLKDGPLIMKDAAEAINTDIYSIDTSRLEKEGIIMRCGLTPTDIMHIKGDFNEFNVEGAKITAEYIKNCIHKEEYSLEQFCDDVYDAVKKKLYSNIVRILMQDKKPSLEKDGLDDQLKDLISDSWESAKYADGTQFTSFSFSTTASLIGIGAPTHIFLPDVAKALNTKCVIPEHASVANAIGAASGNIIVNAVVIVKPNYSVDGIDDYTVCGNEENCIIEDLDTAIEIAKQMVAQEAEKEARQRGANGEISLNVEVVSNTCAVKDDVQVDLGTKVIATATGGMML